MSSNRRYHKKVVLQVIPALGCGGVERGTIEIAKKLKEIGCMPLVMSAGGPLVEKLTEVDVTHISLNAVSKNPFVMWNNSRIISEVIKKYNVDLVHARSRAPAWSCFMAAKATNKKFITTFHGIYNFSSFLKRYYNSIMTQGERIIAVSNFVQQHILHNYNVDESKIRVIHRGVDHHYFDQNNLTSDQLLKFREKYNVPKNVPVILLPSRMTSWKGQGVLIEALNRIKHLDFYCLLVGDLSKHPNFVKRVKDRIVELKLQSKVQIFGNVPDILGLYGISDIVISTSIAPEAFGRIIVEGQAMEKLVIATNIGGSAETIEDRATGYHILPNNIEDLATKIEYCLSILGTPQAKLITTEARNSAINNFSLDIMLNKTLDVYDELVK